MRARPEGRGSWTFWLWKRMERGVDEAAFTARMIWVKASKRQAPKESPTKVILEAGTGS